MSDVYIQHHGIKGQRWGVRRFQNDDGSLTSAGKKRYNDDGSIKSFRTRQLERKSSKIQSDIDSFKPIKNGLKDKKGRQILTKEDVKKSVDGLKSTKSRVDNELLESKNRDSKRMEKKNNKELGKKAATKIIDKVKDKVATKWAEENKANKEKIKEKILDEIFPRIKNQPWDEKPSDNIPWDEKPKKTTHNI